jgi:hypothetical protein
MEITVDDWYFYLEMLSVERTEALIADLALPFEQEAFKEVMSLARACLEVYVFPSIRSQQELGLENPFTQAWHKYRRVQGVLSDAELDRYISQPSPRYLSLKDLYEILYNREKTNDPSYTAESLNTWFTSCFHTNHAWAWQWPTAISILLEKHNQGEQLQGSLPLLAVQLPLVKQIYKQLRVEQLALEVRFREIEQSALRSEPSLWEKVLMNFPPDEGTLKHFPWLFSIKKCLELRLLRLQWGKLQSALGHKPMNSLIIWVRKNSGFLPWTSALPEEPKPLD